MKFAGSPQSLMKSGRSRGASSAATKAERWGGSAGAAPIRLGRPPKGKALLSLQRLLKEALRIVDEQGLEALSMRALAERLGVTAMSLYRYCESHDNLLNAVYDEIRAAYPPRKLTSEQSWREVATELARALRRAFAAHPNAAILFATRPVVTPRSAPHVDAALRRLVEAGFNLGIAANLLNSVSAFTIGLGLAEFGRPAASATRPRPLDPSPHDPSRLAGPAVPYLEQATSPARRHDFDSEFVIGLVAILDGFAARYAKRPR